MKTFLTFCNRGIIISFYFTSMKIFCIVIKIIIVYKLKIIQSSYKFLQLYFFFDYRLSIIFFK